MINKYEIETWSGYFEGEARWRISFYEFLYDLRFVDHRRLKYHLQDLNKKDVIIIKLLIEIYRGGDFNTRSEGFHPKVDIIYKFSYK